MSDPTLATLEESLVRTDPTCRAMILAYALDTLDTLGQENALDVQTFLEAKSSLLDVSSLTLIVRWQAGVDPESALEQTHHLSRKHRAVAARSVLERWAEIDPGAASSALDAIAPKKRTEGGAMAIARGWEASGQPGLDLYIASRDARKKRATLLDEILTRIEKRSGAEAVKIWVMSVPVDAPKDFGRAAHRRAASLLAINDRPMVLQWLNETDEPTYKSAMTRAIAVRWALEDVNAAMGWVSSLAPGAERDQTTREAFRAASKTNLDGAMAWFEAQEYEAWLEPALGFYLGALAHKDAPAAISRVDEIKDRDRRVKTMISILRQWRTQDRSATDAWVQQAGLTPEIRKMITGGGHRRAHKNSGHH